MLYGFGRLAFVLWLCAVGGQVFTLFAFHNAVSQAHTAEIADRLSAVANRVAGAAAERSAIGFPLALQNDLQRRIERLTAGDGGMQLYVVDPRGLVLFGSAQDLVGTTAPRSWFADTSGTAAWSLANEDGVVVGAPILDAFGKANGVVVGRASRQDARIEVLAALRQTATVTALFLLLVAVLAALGTRLLIDGAQRFVRAKTEFYAGLVRRLEEPGGNEPGDTSPVERTLTGLLARLDAAEAAAARIDEATAGTAGG